MLAAPLSRRFRTAVARMNGLFDDMLPKVSGLGQQLMLLSVAFGGYAWLLSHCQIVVPYAVSKAGITSPFWNNLRESRRAGVK